MDSTDKNNHRIWKLALLAWFIGGIGGISVDFDSMLSMATKGATPWNFLHSTFVTGILIGCVVASLGGLVLSLVLGGKDETIESYRHERQIYSDWQRENSTSSNTRSKELKRR